LPLTDIVEFELVWPAWLALGGLGVMAAAMLLLLVIRQPFIAAYLRRSFLRAPTMRGRLLFGFAFVALIPVVTLPPLIGLNSANRLQNEQVAALETLVQSVAEGIPGMVAKRVSILNGLANHISANGDFSDDALVDWLLRHHENNPEIVSMWVALPDGHVPVATAARNGSAERWGGPIAGVGVMDYFQKSVEQGGHYVSTVRKGVSAGFHPMIFISAPIGNEGEEPFGYLQAQVDLSRVFGFVVMQDARAGSDILMTDTQNRVMLSPARLQFRQFESIDGHPLITAMNRQPEATNFTFYGSIRASGEEERYVVATRELPQGWRVFAVVSQGSVQSVALMPLLLGGLWVLMAVLLARGLAGLYGEAVVSPLKKLDESLDIFDAERTMSMIPMAPADAPSEVRDVYRKVRNSMSKSRDAYHNMMKALNEGAELKRKLREVSGAPLEDDHTKAIAVVEGVADEFELELELEDTYHGRIDAVTELPGQELFGQFFKEAWTLGVANGSPVSLILVSVGSENDGTLKVVAEALGEIGGRSLDLVARIEMNEFSVVLPETELEGALAVAERTRSAVQAALLKAGPGGMPTLNLGVASILPNASGNSNSFVEVARRVLQASVKNGNGQIAFINKKGQIHLATNTDVSGADERAG